MDYIELKAQYEESYKEYKKQVLGDLNLSILDGLDDILPIELIQQRGIIEGNVIGCLFNNNELFKDNKETLQEKDFITIEGRLLYRMGDEITKLGIKEMDEISIMSYLDGKNSLSEMFEEYGGMATIKDLKKINIENFESYFDTLQKYNALNRLHIKGFNVLDNLNKFKEMTSNEVYDWHDYMVSNTFLQVSSSIKPIDLTMGNRDYLERADKGLDKGLEIDDYHLNYRLGGIHSGNILLHTAGSGVGKTSSIIPMYILPLIRRGEKVVLLINEQSGDAWRSMILASIINNGFIDDARHEWIARNRFGVGGFTEVEWNELEQASKWLEKYEGNLILYPLEDYSVRTLKKILKKMMRIDENTVFILDTWKSNDDSSANAHAIFTEESKELFNIVKPKDMGGLGVHFIATAQLSGATIGQRYLNVGCLARAKAIKEICGQVLMHRKIWQDELDTKSKFYINPYRYNSETKMREEIQLNPEGDYVIQFFDKNRYGKADFQMVWMADLNTNRWKNIAYCVVKQDY